MAEKNLLIHEGALIARLRECYKSFDRSEVVELC
jgi:hypothetical protein